MSEPRIFLLDNQSDCVVVSIKFNDSEKEDRSISIKYDAEFKYAGVESGPCEETEEELEEICNEISLEDYQNICDDVNLYNRVGGRPTRPTG